MSLYCLGLLFDEQLGMLSCMVFPMFVPVMPGNDARMSRLSLILLGRLGILEIRSSVERKRLR